MFFKNITKSIIVKQLWEALKKLKNPTLHKVQNGTDMI